LNSNPQTDLDRTFERVQILLNQHAVSELYTFYDVAETWASQKHKATIEQLMESIKMVFSFIVCLIILVVMMFGSEKTIRVDNWLCLVGLFLFLGLGICELLRARRYSLRQQIHAEIDAVRRRSTVAERLRAAADSALYIQDHLDGPHRLLGISIRISQNARYYRDLYKR